MRGFKRFLAYRILTYVLVLIVAFSINFLIPRLIPGSPIRSIISRLERRGQRVGGQAVVQTYIHMFGLEGDLLTQYLNYLGQLFQGNLGISISWFPTPVQTLILRSLPWTIGLLLTATIVSWVAGNLLGGLIGWMGESKITKIVFPIALVLSTIPYYLLAILLVFLFAFIFPIFPTGGGASVDIIWQGFSLQYMLDILRHSILPMLSIIISSIGWWLLSMRAMMINVLEEDYVMLAELKGLKRSTIFIKYGFRNALLPQVTGLAMSIGNIMGGALLTEVIFAYPGVGWLLYTAIANLDYPVIQGIVLLIIFSVCTAVLIIDVLYPLIDPRIRLGE